MIFSVFTQDHYLCEIILIYKFRCCFMKENQITDHYNNHPVLPKLIDAINSDKSGNFHIEGLSGSSRSMILSLVFHKTQTTHVVIIPEKEDAAYFYNDLVSILGDESVFFFPSTYKRSVQYEQTEPANIVLRTEAVSYTHLRAH